MKRETRGVVPIKRDARGGLPVKRGARGGLPVKRGASPPGGEQRTVRSVRDPAGPPTGTSASASSQVPPSSTSDAATSDAAELRRQLAERTEDIQRLKAEYDNYRKRVRRDRMALREIAVVNVLRQLLPVLDALDQARRYEELPPGFEGVATLLEEELTALGLAAFGEPGDPFDPDLHEAVTHRPAADSDRLICTEVLCPGYRVGDHLLRPARVAVTGPSGGLAGEPADEPGGHDE